MATDDHQLHFILFPYLAQGHMIPMVDIARLLAQRGVMVTIVTTPLNYFRFKTITDRAIQSYNLPIRILQLPFPCIEAGLPEGCENLGDVITSRVMGKKFVDATAMLQQPLERSLAEMEPMPSCIISDFCFPWTTQTARKFNIPRLIFHARNCFTLLSCHNILLHKAHQTVNSDSEPFVIPGLPDRVEITKSCLPESFNVPSGEDPRGFYDQIDEAEMNSYGVVIDSFYDLEPNYVNEYHTAKQNKTWCIGPVSLYNNDTKDQAERGDKVSIDETQCLKWLDSRQKRSVVYVCLGSLCPLVPAQLVEIGLGLEASQCSFIWAVKCPEDFDKWLSEEGFEERNKDRGLVIRGWAPQVLILSHQAVGGFITHCGSNSTLEGICAGIPMITWPMFAEQFLSEKLLVEILGIGIQVGVGGTAGSFVSKEEITKAVNRLMEKDEEGEKRRRKAKELAEKACKAMKEGGSSYLGMTLLIQDIKHQASKRK
nr:glycosyltransferase [Helleborus thibetanus]